MHALKIGNIQGLAGASVLQCVTIHIKKKVYLENRKILAQASALQSKPQPNLKNTTSTQPELYLSLI